MFIPSIGKEWVKMTGITTLHIRARFMSKRHSERMIAELLKTSEENVRTLLAETNAAWQTGIPSRLVAAFANELVSATVLTPQLSWRQRELLPLVARGLTNTQIAAKLYISEHTVKTNVNRLFAKCDTNSRSKLALIYASGYMSPEERAILCERTAFKWPLTEQPAQLIILLLMLSSQYCDASNAKIGQLLDISEDTVKVHVKHLMNRISGLPRNRQSLKVAAMLHLPQ